MARRAYAEIVRKRAVAAAMVRPTSMRSKKSDHGIIDRVRLTHPDRVLFPDQGLTKRDLAEYYVVVAERMLPELRNRPLSLVRCPEGQGKDCFFQKHVGAGLPAAIRRVTVPERKGDALYPTIENVEGLLGLVQIGVLEIHPWGARADDVEHPDRIVFDLDPDTDLAWGSVVEAAFEIRARLKAHGLESFVKTTGGKGLHVVAPVERSHDWAEVKGFSKALALAAVKDSPERYTATLAKSARQGKIFIDYLRNDRGSTAVAAYSPRARPGAPVASPVAWTALRRLPGSNAYTVETLPRRLARLRDDPWEGIDRLRQWLPKGQSNA